MDNRIHASSGWRLHREMKQETGMKKAYIEDIGYYFPGDELNNNELFAHFKEWTPEQIEKKTGICVRYIAGKHETAKDMAVKAANVVFARGNCQKGNIDFVIFCTQSPDYFLPTSACLIQSELGLPNQCGSFDFNLGCSGYVVGLSLAKGLIESNSARKILLLTGETYSKYMHPCDKSVRTIFGDAATATIIGAIDGESNVDYIGPFVFGTDGAGAESLIVKAGGMRIRKAGADVSPGHEFSDEYLYMDGPAIFAFTLKVVPGMIAELMQKGNAEDKDIDYYIFHQANKFMLDFLQKKIGIASEKFIVDLKFRGNTVSNTIPIVLSDLIRKNGKPKGTVMLVGFGVGLSWASCMLRFPIICSK